MLSRTCIKLFAVYKSWSDARLVCNSNGGDLLTIRHSWMNSFIFGKVLLLTASSLITKSQRIIVVTPRRAIMGKINLTIVNRFSHSLFVLGFSDNPYFFIQFSHLLIMRFLQCIQLNQMASSDDLGRFMPKYNLEIGIIFGYSKTFDLLV